MTKGRISPVKDEHVIGFVVIGLPDLEDDKGQPFFPEKARVIFTDGKLSYLQLSGRYIRKDTGNRGKSLRFRQYLPGGKLIENPPAFIHDIIDAARWVRKSRG